MHYALHYDKPEQRKPHRFTASLAPASLREAMSRGLASNVSGGGRAGQLAGVEAASSQLRRRFASSTAPSAAQTWRDIDDDFAAYEAWRQRGQGTKRWLQERVARQARWQEAVAQNNAKAMVLLGECYEEGVGVPQDYAEAMRWYRKAADAGNSSAMNNIGWLYRTARACRRTTRRRCGGFAKPPTRAIARACTTSACCTERQGRAAGLRGGDAVVSPGRRRGQ
jgi:TPR repeat protein